MPRKGCSKRLSAEGATCWEGFGRTPATDFAARVAPAAVWRGNYFQARSRPQNHQNESAGPACRKRD
eukprot:3702608-Alexandrium_andersonii.AAC.1